MARPVEPPILPNLVAAGIAVGAMVLVPFAVSGTREISPGWPWFASLASAWTYLGLFGWTAFRVRPLPGGRGGGPFTFWYTVILIQLMAYAAVLLGLAGGRTSGVGAGLAFLAGIFGLVPTIFLAGFSDGVAGLLILQLTAPFLLPILFVVLDYLERMAAV